MKRRTGERAPDLVVLALLVLAVSGCGPTFTEL